MLVVGKRKKKRKKKKKKERKRRQRKKRKGRTIYETSRAIVGLTTARRRTSNILYDRANETGNHPVRRH